MPRTSNELEKLARTYELTLAKRVLRHGIRCRPTRPCRNEGDRCRKRQPNPRHGAISCCVNEVGNDGRRGTADGGGEAVRQRESGGSHISGNNLGQMHDHRAVIAGVNEG